MVKHKESWNNWILSHCKYSLDSFHETTFSFTHMWQMAVMFILLYLIMNIVDAYANINLFYTWNLGSREVVAFFLIELLPICTVAYVFGLKRRYGSVHARFFKHAWRLTVHWAEYFCADLWKHKYLIISAILGMFVLEWIFGELVQVFFMKNQPLQHENDKLILMMMRKNALMIIATSFIAPLTEELVFRFWFTNILYHFVSKNWKHQYPRFVYWASALVSAMFFASMHIQGQAPITGVTYIVIALVLQWLMERTHSLTAPVLVHSFSNTILTTMKIFA